MFSTYYEGVEDLPDPNRSVIVPILDPSDNGKFLNISIYKTLLKDEEEDTPLSFAQREEQCEQKDTDELGVGIIVCKF